MSDDFVAVDTVFGRQLAGPMEAAWEAGVADGLSVGGLANVEIRVLSRPGKQAKEVSQDFNRPTGQETESNDIE